MVHEVKPIAMRDAFLRRLYDAMDDDASIFLLSADFGSPVIDLIRADFPDRFINVGIAEQNLVNVATGLSLEGYKVFCYAIAPFITMRCFEQIRVNLALLSEVRELNVNLVGVGAGYSYVVSGPTHQCYEDLSIMRTLPNLSILSPSDHQLASDCFDFAVSNKGPKYIRFDAQILPLLDADNGSLSQGWRRLRTGTNVSLLTTGFATHTALVVADRLASEHNISCEVIDVCRLDKDVDLANAVEGTEFVSLEEAFEGRGGLDAFVRSRFGGSHSVLGIGVRPQYEFELGTREELHEKVGIGSDSVVRRILSCINRISA